MGRKRKMDGYRALGPLPEGGPPVGRANKKDAARTQEAVERVKANPPPQALAPGVKTPTVALRRFVAKDESDVWQSICAVAARQCVELLDAKRDDIARAYQQSIEDIDDDRKQKYGVNLGVSITGDDPKHYTVAVKISFAIKTTESIETQVAVGGDLVDDMEAAS